MLEKIILSAAGVSKPRPELVEGDDFFQPGGNLGYL
jgi:hypothetical protein